MDKKQKNTIKELKIKNPTKEAKKTRGGARIGAGREKMPEEYKSKAILVPGPVLEEVSDLVDGFWRNMASTGGVIDGKQVYSENIILKKIKTPAGD